MEILIAVAAMLGVGLGFVLGRRARPDADALAAATAQAIAANSEQFVQQAGAHVKPLVDDMAGLVGPLRDQLESLNREHRGDKGALTEQLRAIGRSHRDLVAQTASLAQALRHSGEQRGAWGEMQLRRVVELAGMLEHCDFAEQATAEAGGRPDLTIRLPNERQIAIDAKTPLRAYLEMFDAESDAARRLPARRVARQVRARALELSQKRYQNALPRSTDFVILFLPGEFLLPVAVRADGRLLDELVQRNVLIAMLRAVAVGWREVRIAEDAQVIADIGAELHAKTVMYVDHVADQGRNLRRAVQSYNAGIGTLTGRGGLIGLAEKLDAQGVAVRKPLPERLDKVDADLRLP